MDKLERLLELVTTEEDKYYELAFKEMDRNNIVGNMVMTAQASAYQRMRYTIEDLMKG